MQHSLLCFFSLTPALDRACVAGREERGERLRRGAGTEPLRYGAEAAAHAGGGGSPAAIAQALPLDNLAVLPLLHGHCHQKALVGTASAMTVLNAIEGCSVEEIPSGCCGMAGSFGFEEEHFDISMSIGAQTLFPAIREQSGDFAVVAEGVSCRQQIQDGTGKRAMHLVEVLAEAL